VRQGKAAPAFSPQELKQVETLMYIKMSIESIKSSSGPQPALSKFLPIFKKEFDEMGLSFPVWYMAQPEANTTWAPLTQWLQDGGVLAKPNTVRWGWRT
jgi:hypothetical protein